MVSTSVLSCKILSSVGMALSLETVLFGVHFKLEFFFLHFHLYLTVDD